MKQMTEPTVVPIISKITVTSGIAIAHTNEKATTKHATTRDINGTFDIPPWMNSCSNVSLIGNTFNGNDIQTAKASNP